MTEKKKSIFKFSESSLNEDLGDHGQHVWDYAADGIECRKEIATLKKQMEILKAQIRNSVRRNPAKYKLEKVTESALDDQVLCDAEYQGLWEQLLVAENELDQSKTAVFALGEKKSTIEEWVKLHGQSFFATPSVKAGRK